MPTFHVTPDGRVVLVQPQPSREVPEAPYGVYSTLRTYHGRGVVCLEQHLTRLEESAHLLGEHVRLDRHAVRAALREALHITGYSQSRVRLTATPGMPGALFLTLEPLPSPDPALYAEGVRTATCETARERPRAKSVDYIAVTAALYARKPPGIYELLLVSAGTDGRRVILEGVTSNFFGVRGGTLFTAHEAVLAGVTRAIVLAVAAEQGRRVVLEPVALMELDTLDEAFITSSSREVVPVVEIDEVRVGTGRPGEVVSGLGAGYREWVERELEML